MEGIESDEKIYVRNVEPFQEWQNYQKNCDPDGFSDNSCNYKLLLVPALSLPGVEVPESAGAEGNVVHGVGENLQQDAESQPARPWPQCCPPHAHSEVGHLADKTVLVP